MRRISDLSRLKQGRGSGEGASYKPWILTSEVSSYGTAANPVDYITGRTVELLSRNENYYWRIMRFKDGVIDIREQFPLLPLSLTMQIADELGFKHPRYKGQPVVMTTDFLIATKEGYLARNVKLKKDLMIHRVQEKIMIEMSYWKMKNIPFLIITEDSIDKQMALNLELINEYHNIENVHDEFSLMKYLLSNKMIVSDLSQALNLQQLIKENQSMLQSFIQKEELYIGRT